MHSRATPRQVSGVLALGLILGGVAVAQEEGPAAKPPQQAPQVKVQPAQTAGVPRPSGRRALESVEAHRDGAHVPVVTYAERFDIDLGELDLAADPILYFDGAPVTQEDLRRTLCLLAGTNEIDQFITYILAKRVEKRLLDEGYDASGWAVSDQEVLDKFEEQKKFTAQMMGMDGEEWEAQIREVFGWERYLEFQKIQIGFEKLFLPDANSDFMKVQEAKFLEMKKEYDILQAEYMKVVEEERRLAAQENREPKFPQAPVPPTPEADLSFIPSVTIELLSEKDEEFAKIVTDTYARGQKLHPMLRTGVSATLKQNLLARSNIRFFHSLGPEDTGALCKVDDDVIKTEEIYALIQPRLKPAVQELGLREILALRAVDKALERDGHLPTDEQAQTRFAEMEKQYVNSLIPLQHAIMLRGFQNLHHYREYYRRKAAFQAMLETKLGEEDLREHFDRSGRLFFEQGSVDGKILFIPGETRQQAEEAMQAAVARLQAGEPTEQVMRELGKFPPSQDCRDGRFVGMVRNRLRQLLQESEYSSFVTGYSIADDIFYRGQEGSRVGPLYRGYSPTLSGSVLVEVDRFYTTGARRSFEESKASVIEDIADLRFPRYAMEAMAECEISLPPGGE